MLDSTHHLQSPVPKSCKPSGRKKTNIQVMVTITSSKVCLLFRLSIQCRHFSFNVFVFITSIQHHSANTSCWRMIANTIILSKLCFDHVVSYHVMQKLIHTWTLAHFSTKNLYACSRVSLSKLKANQTALMNIEWQSSLGQLPHSTLLLCQLVAWMLGLTGTWALFSEPKLSEQELAKESNYPQ